MIIAPVDNSDAASTTNTLVTKDSGKMPRFFAALTYASLVISIVPFIFSFMFVTISQLYTLPTILAYLFTTPFHVAALLIMCQHSRQIDMQLPFQPSSWRSIIYIGFLAAIWLLSMITCAMGANSFLSGTGCLSIGVDNSDAIQVECYPNNHTLRNGFMFSSSTGLAALEMIILSTMVVVCYQNQPRQENLPTSIRPEPPVPSPKVVSV